MKKKIVPVVFAALLAMTLCACSGQASESAISSNPVSESVASESQSTEEPAQEAVESEATDESSPSFADNVLTLDDYTITITDYKVIQPGETGNEYGEKPVIAFWYDTTNVASETDLNPMTAWMLVFEAVQDNDPNAVNTLNVGMLPDQQFLDSQMQSIKVGGTVSNAVAYELDDLTTPVTLTAQDIIGSEYGSQEFAVVQ